MRVLASLGVSLVVSLVEDEELYDCWSSPEEFRVAFEEAGIGLVRLPTPDFSAPDPVEACKVYRLVAGELERGGRVVFHCFAGVGRTGTMLAGLLAWLECRDPLEVAGELLEEYGVGPQSEDQHVFLRAVRAVCGGCRGAG